MVSNNHSFIDKLPVNQYPTHFWISIYRGFNGTLGSSLGQGGMGVGGIVPLRGAGYRGQRSSVLLKKGCLVRGLQDKGI